MNIKDKSKGERLERKEDWPKVGGLWNSATDGQKMSGSYQVNFVVSSVKGSTEI